MSDRREAQNLINRYLTRYRDVPEDVLFGVAPEAPPEKRERFSPFRPDHAKRVSELAAEFEERARGRTQEEAVRLVAAIARDREPQEPHGLVDYAFNIWVTHARETRGLVVTPLEIRAPEAVIQTQTQDGSVAVLASVAAPGATEADIDWYREDSKANEHHEHWHYVYPTNGVPTTRRVKNRHGEMFFYMHQQMLARYDTERLAVGLDKARSFANYTDPIDEGYEPAPGFRVRPGPRWLDGFLARKPGTKWRDVPEMEFSLAEIQQYKTKFDEALTRPAFFNGEATTANALGRLIEPSRGQNDVPVSGEDGRFGWLHGYGHMLTATVDTDPNDPNEPVYGVMADPATAIRDPFFYRWHRHVDDYYFEWQQRQDPDKFIKHRPPVSIEKGTGHDSPAIILAFNDAIGANQPNFDGDAYGRAHYAGNDREGTTGVLETKMCVRTLTDDEGNPILREDGSTIELQYLDQRPFSYFIRVTNDAAAAQDVTVRVFLVAVEYADDRRMWIEMDKFTRRLEPGLNVLWQPARDASIIKKPAVKPPSGAIAQPADPANAGADETNYCGCGWPYNLLLPRGRRGGMPFRLLVIFTNDDQVAAPKHDCGSMSYCGVRDLDYPDTLEMGYPFHRRFETSIEDAFQALPHAATRDLTIEWIDTQEPKPQYIE